MPTARDVRIQPLIPMSDPLAKPIFLSEHDREQLTVRLDGLTDERSRRLTERLRNEVERATILPASELPAGTVQIGSTVSLRDLDSDEVEEYQLTLPEHADPAQGRLSVLAPLGTAILGFRSEDEIAWEMPGGTRRLRILKVSEPAAARAN